MNSPSVSPGRLTSDETVEVLNNAYYQMMHPNRNNRNKLFLVLSTESTKMASTLFLNIYEVKIFQATYLMLWSNDTTVAYVSRSNLEALIDSSFTGFVRSYFQRENCISFDSFFLFSCFFLFIDDSHILSLLLSLCHIHSHLIITRAQIESFYRSFNIDRKDMNTLLLLLKNSQNAIPNCKSDTYQIKVFIQFMQHSPYFTNTLTLLRCEFINKIIGAKNHNIIKKKMYYYYHNSSNHEDTVNYTESCMTRFYDKHILHRPPYYYADYTLLHPKNKDIEDIVYMIRQKYGYSQRSHSSLLPINLSERSYTMRNSKGENTILSNHNTINNKNSSILFTYKKIICNPPSCNSFPIDVNISSYGSIRNEKYSSNEVKSPHNSSPFENDT